MTLPPEDIALVSSVTLVGYRAGGVKVEYDKLGVKGMPLHVKAALNYNNMIRQHGLKDKYLTIADGDKIKYVHLKEPNPSDAEALAMHPKLPEEFELHSYVDRVKQYEKAFAGPLEKLAQVAGWSLERRSALEF